MQKGSASRIFNLKYIKWNDCHQCADNLCRNISTTPLLQWGFRQCLPFSWTTLRGKHCRHPIAVMGVVDMFGLCPLPSDCPVTAHQLRLSLVCLESFRCVFEYVHLCSVIGRFSMKSIFISWFLETIWLYCLKISRSTLNQVSKMDKA